MTADELFTPAVLICPSDIPLLTLPNPARVLILLLMLFFPFPPTRSFPSFVVAFTLRLVVESTEPQPEWTGSHFLNDRCFLPPPLLISARFTDVAQVVALEADFDTWFDGWGLAPPLHLAFEIDVEVGLLPAKEGDTITLCEKSLWHICESPAPLFYFKCFFIIFGSDAQWKYKELQWEAMACERKLSHWQHVTRSCLESMACGLSFDKDNSSLLARSGIIFWSELLPVSWANVNFCLSLLRKRRL